ncbi:MAG: AAA family ATPase [Aureispira sp.]
MEEEKGGLVEEPVYITGLEICKINCFKKSYSIDFSDAERKPSMWTVLLGNNNTGKTTLLRIIAALGNTSYPFGTFSSVRNTNTKYYNNALYLDISKYFSPLDKEENDTITKQCSITTNKKEINSSFASSSKSKKNVSYTDNPIIIDAYGTQRKQGQTKFIEYQLEDRVESLFEDDTKSLINAEDWFLGTKFNALMESKKAAAQLEQVKNALVTLLPDIKDIQIGGEELRRVHFITNSNDKVLINQLGSGYQSLITWVVDYAKRQFDRYPESSNPLAEPGIVLVDEIDLHLHPTWQRKVIRFLRNLFPKTQFIVTAHSPLVVQSADDINVVVLHREEATDEIKIEQPELTNFQGWSVEEILRDLMDAQIYSNEYLELRSSFTQAIEEDNYKIAKETFQELERILHPTSTQIELMRLQMTSLSYD